MSALPTLPGMVHGIVGRDPWRIQCDRCGAVEEPGFLVLMRTRFNSRRYDRGDRRRLCVGCAAVEWPERS
jgi:hypothetical protein